MVDREKAKWLLQQCVPVFKCKPCSIKVVNDTYVITETSTETLTKLQQHLSRKHTTQYTDVQSNITECLQHYTFELLCQDCSMRIPEFRYETFEDLLAVIEKHLRDIHTKTYESVDINVISINAPYCSNIRERYVYLKGSTFKCTLCFQAVQKEVAQSSWYPGGNLTQHLLNEHGDESSNTEAYTSKYHWFWDHAGIDIATDGSWTPKCLICEDCKRFTKCKEFKKCKKFKTVCDKLRNHMTNKHKRKLPIMIANNDLDEMSIESYINLRHPPAGITVQENQPMDLSVKRAKLQSDVSDKLVADSSRDKPIHNVSKRARLADQCGDRSVHSALQHDPITDVWWDRPVHSASQHGPIADEGLDKPVHSASQYGLTAEPCRDRSIHSASQHRPTSEQYWDRPVHYASQHVRTAHLSNNDILTSKDT
ncbi:PREDICTED: uncharacterized protein LOC105558093 [Vollenhovia emeryi]|uniref:uncharacterized protein LOC105558093 n=1 Tax=Vollenhovia emeryi TaxID=411798 RepID=UPI0005F3D71B|nr:PREDICTED: uncharacterized protein LOC105558093 [Vollenhovia emeryi]